MGNSTQRNILNTVTINFAVKGTSATQKHAKEMGDSYKNAWDEAKKALKEYQDSHARDENPKTYDKDIKGLKTRVKEAEKDFKAWKELFDKGVVDYQKFMDYLSKYDSLGPSKLTGMLAAIRKSIKSVGDLYDAEGNAIEENHQKLAALAQAERLFNAQADTRTKGVISLTKVLDRMNTSYAEASNYVKAYERNARDLAQSPKHLEEMNRAALQNKLTMHECVGEWKLLTEESSAQDFQQNIRTFKDVSAWAQKMGIDIKDNVEMAEQFQMILSRFEQQKPWSLLSADEMAQNIKDLQQISSLIKSDTQEKAQLDHAIHVGQTVSNDMQWERMDESRKKTLGEYYEKLGKLSDDFVKQEQERWKREIETVERGTKAWLYARDVYAELSAEAGRRKMTSATGVVVGEGAMYKQEKEKVLQRIVSLEDKAEELPIAEKNGKYEYKDAEEEKKYAEAVERVAHAEQQALDIEKKRAELASAQGAESKASDKAKEASAALADLQRIDKEVETQKQEKQKVTNEKLKQTEDHISDIQSKIDASKKEIEQYMQGISSVDDLQAASEKKLDTLKKKAEELKKKQAEQQSASFITDEAAADARHGVSMNLKGDIDSLLHTNYSSFDLTREALDKLIARIETYKNAVKSAIEQNDWKGTETDIKNLSRSIEIAEEQLHDLRSKAAGKDKNDALISQYAQGINLDGSAFDKASHARDLLARDIEAAKQRALDEMNSFASRHGADQQAARPRSENRLEIWSKLNDDERYEQATTLIKQKMEELEARRKAISENPVFDKEERKLNYNEVQLIEDLRQEKAKLREAIQNAKNILENDRSRTLRIGENLFYQSTQPLNIKPQNGAADDETEGFISKLRVQQENITKEIKRLTLLSNDEIRKAGQGAIDAVDDLRADIEEMQSQIDLAQHDTQSLTDKQAKYSAKISETSQKIETLKAQRHELSKEEKEEIKTLTSIESAYRSSVVGQQNRDAGLKAVGASSQSDINAARDLTDEEKERLALLIRQKKEAETIGRQIQEENKSLKDYNATLSKITKQIEKIENAKKNEDGNKRKIEDLKATLTRKESNLDKNVLTAGKKEIEQQITRLYADKRTIEDILKKAEKQGDKASALDLYLQSDASGHQKKDIEDLEKAYGRLNAALTAYNEGRTKASEKEHEIERQSLLIGSAIKKISVLKGEETVFDRLDEKAAALEQHYAQTTRGADMVETNKVAQQYAPTASFGKIADAETAKAIESISAVPEKISSALGKKMGDQTVGESIRQATEMFSAAFKSYRYQTDEAFKKGVDEQWNGFKKHIESYSKSKGLFGSIEKNIPNISSSLDDANAQGEAKTNRRETIARNSIANALRRANAEVTQFKESLSDLMRGEDLTALNSRLKQGIDSLSDKSSVNKGSVLIDKATAAIVAFDDAQKATSQDWHDYVTRAADGTNIFEEKIEKLRDAIKRYREAATVTKDKDGNIIKDANIEKMETARKEVARLSRAIEEAKPTLGTKKDNDRYMATISPFTSAVSQAARAAKEKKSDKMPEENRGLQKMRDDLVAQYESIFVSLKFKTNTDFQSAVKEQIASDEAAINKAIDTFKQGVKDKNLSLAEEAALGQGVTEALRTAREHAERIIKFNDTRSIETAVADVRKGLAKGSAPKREKLDVGSIEESATEKALGIIKAYNEETAKGTDRTDYKARIHATQEEIEALEKLLDVKNKIDHANLNLDKLEKMKTTAVQRKNSMESSAHESAESFETARLEERESLRVKYSLPKENGDKNLEAYLNEAIQKYTTAIEERKRIEDELAALEQSQTNATLEDSKAVIQNKEALAKQLQAINAEINENKNTYNVIDNYEKTLIAKQRFAHLSIEEIKEAMGVWQEEMRKCFDDDGKLTDNTQKWKTLNAQYQQAGEYLQIVATQSKMAQANAMYDRVRLPELSIDTLTSMKQQMEQASLAAKQLGQNTSMLDGKILHVSEAIETLKKNNLSNLMTRVFGIDGRVNGSEYIKLLPQEMKTLDEGLKRLATEAKINGDDTMFAKYTTQLRELNKVATEVTASQSLLNIRQALADDGKSEGFYLKRIQELVSLREQGNLTQKEVEELNAAILGRGKAKLEETLSNSDGMKTIDDMRLRIEMLKQYRSALDVTTKEGEAERQTVNDTISKIQKQYDALIDKEKKLSELDTWGKQRDDLLKLVDLARQGELTSEKMQSLVKSLEDVRVKGLQLGADKNALGGLKAAAADVTKEIDKIGETIFSLVKGKNGKISKQDVLGLSDSELKSLQSYLDKKGKDSFAEGLRMNDMSVFSEVAASIRDVKKATEELEAGKTLEKLAAQANSQGGQIDYYARVINDINKLRDSGTLAAESMGRLNEVLDAAKVNQQSARDAIKRDLTKGSIFDWDRSNPTQLNGTNLTGKSIEDIEMMKRQLEDMRKSLSPSTDMTLIEQTDIAINQLQKALDSTQKKIKEIREEMSSGDAWDVLSNPLDRSEQDITKAKKILEDKARQAFARGGLNGIVDIDGEAKTSADIIRYIQQAQMQLDLFAKKSKIPQMMAQFNDIKNMTKDAIKQQIEYWKELENQTDRTTAEFSIYEDRRIAAESEMRSRLRAQGQDIISSLGDDDSISALPPNMVKEYIDGLSQAKEVLKTTDSLYDDIVKKLDKLKQRQNEISASMDTWKDEALKLGEKGFDIQNFRGSIKDLENYKKALLEYRKSLQLYKEDSKGNIVHPEELQKVDRALRMIAGTTQKLAKETNAYGTLSESVFEQIQKLATDDGKWGASNLAKAFKKGQFSVEDLRNSVKRLKEELDTTTHKGNEYFIKAEEVRRAEELLNELETKASDHAGILQKAVQSISSYVGTFLSFQKFADFARQAYHENMAFSDALTDVQRTTQMTTDDINELADALQTIDTRASNEEVFKLATTAGQLGIKGVDNIRGFVEAADMLTITLSELGEEGVTNLTKISNLMGDTEAYGYEKALKKIGSSIKDLSSNTAASAGPITEFIGRMGSTAAQAGLTSSQIAALGATLDANAQSVERGATGLTKFLVGLEGKSHNIAEALHISPRTLDELLQSGQTMEAIYLMLEKIKESGGASSEVLKIFGSRGAQMAPIFNTLAEHLGELKENVDLSNKSFEEGISIESQFMLKNSNAAGYMARTSNLIKKQYVNSGWTKFWGVLSEGIYKTVQVIIDFNKAIGYFAPILKAFILYLTLSGARVDMLTKKMWRAIVTSRSWKKAMLGLMSAFKSGSWINIAIAAITMLIDLTVTYINKAKEAAQEGVRQAANVRSKISSAISQADVMFKSLERYKKGSKEYGEIIQQINSQYGKYLNFRISEISTASELAIAQQRINAGLREEIALREEQNAKDAISEKYDADVMEDYTALTNHIVAVNKSSAVKNYTKINLEDAEDRIKTALSKVTQKGANEGWKIGLVPSENKKDPLYKELYKELYSIFGDDRATLLYIRNIFTKFRDYFLTYQERQKAYSDVDTRIAQEKRGAAANKHEVDMKEMYQIRKEYERGLAMMKQNPSAYSEKDYKRLFQLGDMYRNLANKNRYEASPQELKNIDRFVAVVEQYRKQLAEGAKLSTEYWAGQTNPLKMDNKELLAYNKKLFNEYSNFQSSGDWKYFGSRFGQNFSENNDEAEQQARDWVNEQRLLIEKEFARRHVNKSGTWWANENDDSASRKAKKDTKETIDVLLKELEEYYNRQQTAIESEGLSMGRAQELIDRDVNAKHQEYLNMRIGLINSMVGKETKLNAKQQEAYKMFTNEAIAANKKRYAELKDIVETGSRDLTEAEAKEYESLSQHANSMTGWDSIFDPATFMADIKKIQAFFKGSDAASIRKEYSDFVKSLGEGSRDLTAEELQRYNKVRQNLGMGQNVDKATIDEVKAAAKDAEAQAANKDVETRKVLADTLLKGSQSMLEYQKAWAKQIESLRQVALEGAPMEKATDDFRAAIMKLGILFGDSDKEKKLSLDTDEFKRRMEALKEMSADILVMTESDFEKRIEKTSFYHSLWERQYGELEDQFIKRRKMGIKALYQETMKYRDALDNAVRKKAQNQAKLLASRVQNGSWYEEMYKKYDTYLQQLKAQGKTESEEYASIARVRKYMFDRMNKDGVAYYSRQQETLKKLQHDVKIEGIIKDLGVSNGTYQSLSEMKVARQQLLMERENLNARISLYGGIVAEMEAAKAQLGKPRMNGESEEDYAERLNKLRTIEYNLNIARISNEELVKEAKEKTLEAETALIEKERALMSQRLESISQWREVFDELTKSLATAGASEAESKNWEIAELRAKKALGLTRDTTKQRMLILKQSGDFEEKWLTQEEQMQEEKRIAAMNERAAAWEKFFNSFGEKLSKTMDDIIMHQVQKNLAMERAQEIADVEADAQQAGLDMQKHQQEAYNKELEKILNDRVKLFQSAQDMIQNAMGADGTLDVSLNAEELDRNTLALTELTDTMSRFVDTYSDAPEPTSNEGSSNRAASAGSPTGTLREKQQYMSQRFQKELGLNRQQAAGLIGNLMHESNLDASAKNPNSTAYGIAQWLKPRQQTFKTVMGKDIHGSSLEDQTSFVINEMQRPEFSSALNDLRGASTVEDAAKAVYYKYEIPYAYVNGKREQVDHTEYSRVRLANRVYNNTSALSADFSAVGNVPYQQPYQQPEQSATGTAISEQPAAPIAMTPYDTTQTDMNAVEPMATPRISFSTEDMTDLQAFKEQNNQIVNIQEKGDERRKKSATACAQAMIQAANMYGTVYQAVTNKNLSGQEKAQQAMLGIVGQVSNAMLSVLMQEVTAKSTADQGSAIGKAFAQLGPIGGAAAVAGITSMFGLLLGLASNAVSKGQSKISAITGSASAGKLSTGMLTYASGRYDNDSDYRKGKTYTVHGNDGNDYDAVFEGRGMATGIRGKEHFGIFSEVKPEMVIDGDTTQKLVSRYPYLYNSILDIANGKSPRLDLDYAYITKMLDKISMTQTMGKRNMANGMPTFAAGNYPYQYDDRASLSIMQDRNDDAQSTAGGISNDIVMQLIQVLTDLRDRGVSSNISMKDFDDAQQRYNRWKKVNGLK